ncbi:hypothetical protein [Saccharopolyspora sp. NPDC050642]|uniref:hypothetical protein n=1 Tax=Saccharopolyspora sp. NPDC050642 TaxID=3157099 RepID=UPI0033F1E49D
MAGFAAIKWAREVPTLLHNLGWTDPQIAAHCRMTTYTTGRIRERLKLRPNDPTETKENR